jgi:hypothetical protein
VSEPVASREAVEVRFGADEDRHATFIANAENPALMSAIRKVSGQCHRPGAVVLLTADEFEAFTDPAEFRKVLA